MATASPTIDRQQLLAQFTPPDLADALTGTIHRLEDDHMLVRHKRWSVVKELAMTEAQYLRDLLLLRTTFMEPLAAVMTAADVRLVFCNLDQVIECARALVEYLTVAVVYEGNRERAKKHRKDDSFELDHKQWQCASRPVSQPEAPRAVGAPGAGLRSSAWADISLARAFLLMAHRMERVYTTYCQNFDAASQRLIDLKRLAAGGQTPNTTPATPHIPSAGNSPFTDHAKGWRQSHNEDTDYAIGAHQVISDQAQQLAGKTTSWDLASMLIKPVQRVLKYPLLLRTLVSLTPAGTSDRTQLEKAAQGIEYIAEAINAASSGSGNMRVSTASAGSAPHDDGHGRIARELRRVLRRKPGASGHLRSKSNVEGVPGKVLIRRKVKDVIDQAIDVRDRVPQLPALAAASPLAELGTQIQQHETQLADMIHRLRLWEQELGSALLRQCALVARWRDLYMLSGPDASTDSGGESDSEGLLDREYQAWGGFDADECRPRAALESPRGEPMLRPSKSYGSLRRPGQIPVSRLPHAAANWTPRQAMLASHHSIMDLKASDLPETPWQAQRKAQVAKWSVAMENISKSLFPDLITQPLQDSVYPVLSSLLQAYRDGPRRILNDIARMSNGSSTVNSCRSSLSDSANEPSEAARRESQLATELPQMFEHEAEVVHLLTVRVVALEREFLSQVLAEMTCACVQPVSSLRLQSPLGRQQQYWIDAQWIPRFTAMTAVPPLPAKSSAVSPRSTIASLGTESVSWAKQIADEYERRAAVGNVTISGPLSPPAANECLEEIQTAVSIFGGLTGGSQRNSGDSAPVETDMWTSAIANRFDTAEDNLLLATVPTSVSDTTAVPARWNHSESPGSTSGRASPKNSKLRHLRKKSGGFKDKLSYLKTNMPLPEHLRLSSKRGSGRRVAEELADQVKARPPLGLAIDVPTEAAEGKLVSSVPNHLKYDPLPHISSIRFSRGFIDSAFMNTSADSAPATGSAGDTGCLEPDGHAVLVNRPLASPQTSSYLQSPSNAGSSSPFAKTFY
ncbi:hypothetical protein EC988_003249 [Linderina pennispora]|nr:hypothetical protein EC988_003249 [Linderina pennispora]